MTTSTYGAFTFTADHSCEAYRDAAAAFTDATGWDPMGVSRAAADGESIPLDVFGAGVYLDIWDCWLFTGEWERISDPCGDFE